jgi:hypothetical protein
MELNGTTLSTLPTVIAATGALGTTAFGLVDACKVLPGGGISRAGFKFIRQTIRRLVPEVAALDGTGLSRDSLLFTLQSHWINSGTLPGPRLSPPLATNKTATAAAGGAIQGSGFLVNLAPARLS